MPVQVDQFPDNIEDAVEFTKLEPPIEYSELELYERILNYLRFEYRGKALKILRTLLLEIKSDSIEDTEQKIDLALKALSDRAPVQWVLDVDKKKILRDGSCLFHLISADLYINPNGAFAIISKEKDVWLEQTSKYGVAFVYPTK